MKDYEKGNFVKEKKAKKSKKKKSKKKRSRSSSKNEDLVIGESDENSRKKKKTKPDTEVDEEFQESNVEESLEGALVDGEMVLIDRKSGKVFSGLERRENGERKEIGTVSKSGSIVLNKTEKGKNKTKNSPSFNPHVSKPAWTFTVVLAWSNIMPECQSCYRS